MQPDRFKQLEQLVHATLEQDPAQRTAFLHEACQHDEELEREALSLLSGQSEASDSLENPAEVMGHGTNPEEFRSPLLNKSLGPYKVLQLLGRGGMGEVYLAKDTRLERRIALKLLPEEFSHDKDRLERFRREAHAASALNHPNILTIHEIGEVEGRIYLVTEYIEGQTLRQRLAEGRLDLKESLEIGSQIASALAAAHQVGIVHRDLKPENLMLRPDELVKVLDFGLAKVTPTGTTPTDHTQTGILLGTVAYMSPEQARGQKLDGRSDLFSLGVVLYEMVAGERPFYGPTSSDILVAILEKKPARLEQLRSGVPEALEQIVAKALAKDPAGRYQTASDLRADLNRLKQETTGKVGGGQALLSGARRAATLQKRWMLALGFSGLFACFAVLIGLNVGGLRDRLAPRAVSGRIQSLAVLPLANLSGNPEQEYFADGMTEELITNLAKISALKVISRTSMMQYKGTKKPLPQIAKELNVDAVIEGSVLREGGRVRVTAQLIQASTDQHLWAESYERDLRSVLAMQSEMASVIAEKVHAALTPAERSRLASARPVNPVAYELYLQGQYHYYKWRPDEFQKAIAYFQKAIEADPKWGPAYTGLANSYGWLWMEGTLPPQEVLPRFNAALSTAMEIDDTLPEVRYTLAVRAFYYRWDWGEAEREFKRALALNPNLVEARYEYAWFLSSMGRIAESLTEAKRAVERDPLSVTANLALGSMYSMARQYDQAISQLRHTIELEPNDSRGYGFLAGAYEQTGMYEEAVTAHQKAMTLSGAQPGEVAALRRAYSQSGYKGYLMWFLGRQNDPYFSALFHTRLGHKDEALVYLEKAYTQHRWEMVQLKVGPAWDPLRSDPRFQDLLRRMNFPP